MKLKDLTLGEPEKLNILVEVPKGSPAKLEYDEETEQIKEEFVFKDGFKYIYNYGLIPGTLADDGDHLDAIVLTDKIIPSGTVMQVRPFGIIKVIDRGEGDDKLLTSPLDENKFQSIRDLSETQRQEFVEFYAEVARQKNKEMHIVDFLDKDAAIEEIKKCAKNYAVQSGTAN
jgi:inorganic pyrophosphatase